MIWRCLWRWLQGECHNFVRVLLLHDNLVFACGTNSYKPQCSWRKVSYILAAAVDDYRRKTFIIYLLRSLTILSERV